MNRTLASLTLALVLCGCDNTIDGGGSDAGPDGGAKGTATAQTVQGHTLTPRSVVSSRVNIAGTQALAIVITDHPDICSTFDCRIGKPGPDGVSMTFVLTGQTVFFNAAGSSTDLGRATVSFAVTESGGATTFTDVSMSGTVTVGSLREGELISGSYELTMRSGAVLSGTFVAPWCSRLNRTLVGDGIQCSSTDAGTGACSNSCTCEGRTVSNSCTQMGSNSWSCTCRSPTGATTSCMRSVGVGNTDACWEYGTCCPFEF